MRPDRRSGIKIGPDDPRYEPLCRGFNPRWRAEPDHIRLPRTAEEVKNALQEALHEPSTPQRSRITVRSGGHCYEDFVCSADVRVIIDLSLMDGVQIDEATDTVCVEAGVTNGHLYKKLCLPTGRALPGGSCPSVGIGGHVVAGGFGPLSRQHGLTVDYLHAVEVAVVTENGEVELVTATADDTDTDLADLWWAHTGGGGGNFGVITRLWFRGLPPAPRSVFLATGGWEWKHIDEGRFRRIVENFGAFFEQHQGGADDEYADLFGILLLSHASRTEIGLIAQIDSGVRDARRLITDFQHEINSGVKRALGPLTEAHGEFAGLAVLGDLFTGSRRPAAVPWTVVEKVTGAPHNDRCGKHKSAYMRTRLPEDQAGALWQALTADREVSRDAVVQIDSYGSAINRRRPGDTATAQRDSVLKLQHQAYWPVGQSGDDQLRWIRTLYRDMYPHGVPSRGEHTDGCYIGYPDVDLGDPEWNTSGIPWPTLYYGVNYPRLRRAKGRWDPNNVFRHAQSIEPPDGAGPP
ncbi:FAD-binding oxidoreductase [Streptosporangium carneum]|uniref:FAD-binding oxidoreductase n=1 Tax=Streptosporangium carneum TaxID=47481 RepID=UPI0022F2AFF8|nr:FAD-binding oxidoreductase [Streptosporangium carneum]